MQRVQRNQPSVPHPAGAGQSGGEQAWEMFLFSELKAQKNKSSQEKKKKKGFIAQRGFIPISSLSLAERQKVNS